MLNVAKNFRLDGNPVHFEPLGNGHINRTYLLVDDKGSRYALQKINDTIFKDVPALMENIRLVTEFQRSVDPDPRHSLHLMPAMDGKCFYRDETGYYRVYRFVEGSVCLEKVESKEEFFLSAQAFGSFQNQLADFDASRLSETIPKFHDTFNRVNNLKIAAEKDKMGRFHEVRAESGCQGLAGDRGRSDRCRNRACLVVESLQLLRRVRRTAAGRRAGGTRSCGVRFALQSTSNF